MELVWIGHKKFPKTKGLPNETVVGRTTGKNGGLTRSPGIAYGLFTPNLVEKEGSKETMPLVVQHGAFSHKYVPVFC
jgi:hypothetical protein